MEGPSLFLAAEQLAPFIGKKVLKVDGNTKIGKERLLNKKILDIFSWGKHLVFQFDDFALRVHFMLFGSFEAVVDKNNVTGDYPKRTRTSRLQLIFSNGQIDMYSCSVKFIENADAKELYDFSIDVMSSSWDTKESLKKMKEEHEKEIGDVLLDQTIFSGVGNIIKNEVLFLVKITPTTKIKDLSLLKLKEIIKTIRDYCFQFYEWRKNFVLRKHFQIYRKGICPKCQNKIIKKKTGSRERMSYFCTHCQK